MNSEITTEQNCCNNQSHWLSQVDSVNDTEASQVNGGSVTIPPMDAGTTAIDAGTSEATGIITEVQNSLTQSLAMNSALQQLYLSYSTFTEALRIISEAVQKGIDISENERQDISQGQE